MWCLSNKKKIIQSFFSNKPLIKVAKVEESLTETLNKYTSALNMINLKCVGIILGLDMTITVFTCSHFVHLDSSSLSSAAWNLFDREQIKGMLKQISIVMNSAERKHSLPQKLALYHLACASFFLASVNCGGYSFCIVVGMVVHSMPATVDMHQRWTALSLSR